MWNFTKERRKKLDSSIYFMIVFPKNDYPRYRFKNSPVSSWLYFTLGLGVNENNIIG